MATVYRIKNWDKHFETAASRRLKGSLKFAAVPTKHDGKGYKRLMRQYGPAIYGGWVLLVSVAAKCPVRGILADTDGPLSALDIADKTECPVNIIEQTLAAVTDPDIGWMVIDDESATISSDHQRLLRVAADCCGNESNQQRSAAISSDAQRSAATCAIHNLTKPDLTRPNLTEPNQTQGGGGGDGGDLDFGSGEGRESKRGRGVRDTRFKGLVAATLRDDRELDAWFQQHVQHEDRLVANSDIGRMQVFAAAERAIEVGKQPVALFRHLLAEQSWGLISNTQEDRARKRLIRLRRSKNS